MGCGRLRLGATAIACRSDAAQAHPAAAADRATVGLKAHRDGVETGDGDLAAAHVAIDAKGLHGRYLHLGRGALCPQPIPHEQRRQLGLRPAIRLADGCLRGRYEWFFLCELAPRRRSPVARWRKGVAA